MTTALIIIDVQRGLFDDEPRPYEADAVVGRINALAERARASGAPVVFVQHERAEGMLQYGSESWQLERNLIVKEGDVFVRKSTPDSFLGTPLAELLAARGAKRLVICGYASEFCVDTTTRRAAALGFPVLLAADAHTTHDKEHAGGRQIREHHNITLANVTSFGPRIVATESAHIVFQN
ncbi:MAG TPA: cysteine hydrolase family protein [Paucimonas sp.]|nr:cysteine hydrolase family protein [Paucimonas sp.]